MESMLMIFANEVSTSMSGRRTRRSPLVSNEMHSNTSSTASPSVSHANGTNPPGRPGSSQSSHCGIRSVQVGSGLGELRFV